MNQIKPPIPVNYWQCLSLISPSPTVPFGREKQAAWRQTWNNGGCLFLLGLWKHYYREQYNCTRSKNIYLLVTGIMFSRAYRWLDFRGIDSVVHRRAVHDQYKQAQQEGAAADELKEVESPTQGALRDHLLTDEGQERQHLREKQHRLNLSGRPTEFREYHLFTQTFAEWRPGEQD